MDLTVFFKELEDICSEYRLNYDIIKYNKVNVGVHLLWIDTSVNEIVAYKLNGLDTIHFMDGFLNKTPVKAKTLPIVLDTDTILDKISKYGMSSLVEEELEFLNNS